MLNPVHTVAQTRDIEQAALSGLPAGTLMQRAGQAATALALTLVSEPLREVRVLILAGPGNNGGDALEVAGGLAQAGLQVTVLLFADTARQSPDACAALQRAQTGKARFADPALAAGLMPQHWDIVIDGLFGIGLTRPIAEPLRGLIETINTFACPVLALDVPSGLNADTGNIIGANGIAVQASHTITFITDKPGLHTCDGRDYAGQVQVAKLDIDNARFPPAHAWLNDVQLFFRYLKPRLHNSHKGSYGDVIVIGGAHGMMGAPILAASAAAKCGAGRVFAAFLDTPPAYDSMHPELMCRAAHDIDFANGVLVAGPGLGTSRNAHDVLARGLQAPVPMVLDADALNLIAVEPGLRQKLAQRRQPALITPHPLEAARLLARSAHDIQADRPSAARELARQFNATVILKGSGSVIARPDGGIAINPTGNPALATAGTGDVLAGMCGALLAQDWPAWEAALGAAWLHGHAADMLVTEGIGPIGLTASELIPRVRSALNQLTRTYAKS